MDGMLLLGAASATGLTGAALYGLNRLAIATVRPPQGPAERDPDQVSGRRRDVSFTVDGFTLRGWLFNPDAPSDRALVIMVHGWSAASDRLFGLADALVREGHPVFAFDVRAHGRSDDAPYTTLRHWRDDVAAAVRFASEELPFTRRLLVGHSMGAAASTVVAADGAPIQGLVLLAGPADVLEVTAGYLTDHGLPGGLLSVVLLPFWRRLAGMSFVPLRPESRIREVGVPVLLLQGDSDLRVPPNHMDRFQIASGAPAVRVQGAGHMDLLDRPETSDAILRFISGLT